MFNQEIQEDPNLTNILDELTRENEQWRHSHGIDLNKITSLLNKLKNTLGNKIVFLPSQIVNCCDVVQETVTGTIKHSNWMIKESTIEEQKIIFQQVNNIKELAKDSWDLLKCLQIITYQPIKQSSVLSLQARESFFEMLPQDLLLQIFQHVSFNDLLNLASAYPSLSNIFPKAFNNILIPLNLDIQKLLNGEQETGLKTLVINANSNKFQEGLNSSISTFQEMMQPELIKTFEAELLQEAEKTAYEMNRQLFEKQTKTLMKIISSLFVVAFVLIIIGMAIDSVAVSLIGVSLLFILTLSSIVFPLMPRKLIEKYFHHPLDEQAFIKTEIDKNIEKQTTSTFQFFFEGKTNTKKDVIATEKTPLLQQVVISHDAEKSNSDNEEIEMDEVRKSSGKEESEETASMIPSPRLRM